MPVVLSSTDDPFANAALESLLFERSGDRGPFLFLYSNCVAIVLGRHQNPWVECNMAVLGRDAIPLVRRISGGGTVYHDPGNLNFSFMSSADHYNLDTQFDLVLSGLSRVGIHAERNERNDLVADGRKFSGNAFRHSRGNSLHHGTLLVASELSRLQEYLAAPVAEIQTKAIESVRSSVVNLSELAPGLTPEAVRGAVAAEFAEHSQDSVVIRPGAAHTGAPSGSQALAAWFPASSELAAERERLAGWEWLFGHTPTFSRTYRDESGRALTLTVKKGRIADVVAEPDGDSLAGINELVGRPLARETVGLLRKYDWAAGFVAAMREDLW